MDASKLSEVMGVTENDVNRLLNMIMSSMVEDGMSEIVIEMSVEDRVNTVEAYMQAEIKKFHDFCVTLLTNPEKKSAFDSYLYSQLKETK